MIRKVFIGCNTADGFCSFFDFFMNPHNVKIYILKGGPGNGKSSFLKYIGEEMTKRGYNIELQYCSFDCESLDAVVIPSKKAAVVAATGHHVMDPRHPGIVEEILNLGTYLDVEGMRDYGETIMAVNNRVEPLFRRAYRYLKAARLMAENMEDINSNAQNFAQVNLITEEILSCLFDGRGVADRLGRERHLFASSLTPDGYLSLIDTLVQRSDVYKITGSIGTGKTTMLKKIGAEARARGLGVEYYHSPLDPAKLEHLIIPELNASLMTVDHERDHDCLASYNLDRFLQESGDLSQEEARRDGLVNEAARTLKEAKMLHLGLEKYYVSNMNFAGVDTCKNGLLQKILNRDESEESCVAVRTN